MRIDPLFPDNAAANVSGAYVTFELGARSAWHEHPAGQTLVVISGVGLTGTSDGKVVEIRAGDVVRCPPNVRHWHGAAPHGRHDPHGAYRREGRQKRRVA